MSILSSKKKAGAAKEVKASLAYTVCSIVQRAISFLTLPFFARILSETEYGQVTVYDTISTMIAILITLYMPYGTLTTALSKFDEVKKKQYLSSVQTIMTLHAMILLAVYFLFRDAVDKLTELPSYLFVIMIFQVLFSAAVQCWYTKQRFEYKYIEVVSVTIMMAIASPIVMFLFIMFSDEKGYAKIMGGALVTIVTGFIIYVRNMWNGRKFFSKELWKYAYSFNIPLIAFYLSQALFNQSDKLVVEKICGLDKAGIYGVAYSLSIVLNFLVTAIGNSYIPWLYGRIRNKDVKKNRGLTQCFAVSIAVILLGIIWFAPEMIMILLGSKYVEAKWIVPPVTMTVLIYLYITFATNLEFYYECKRNLIWTSVCAALTNVVLNLICVPRFGYYAAGYTTLISYLLWLILSWKYMIRRIGENEELKGAFDCVRLSAILAGFIGTGFLGMALYRYLIIRIMIMLVVGGLLLIYREKVLDYIKRYWNALKQE